MTKQDAVCPDPVFLQLKRDSRRKRDGSAGQAVMIDALLKQGADAESAAEHISGHGQMIIWQEQTTLHTHAPPARLQLFPQQIRGQRAISFPERFICAVFLLQQPFALFHDITRISIAQIAAERKKSGKHRKKQTPGLLIHHPSTIRP